MRKLPKDHTFSRHLKDRFRELGQSHAAQRRRPRWQIPRPLLVAGGVALLGGGVAVGRTEFTTDEQPVSGEHKPPANIAPDPHDRRLSSLRVTDPIGGPPWSVRLYSGAKGRQCIVLGQVRHDELGMVRLGGFHPYPANVPGTCSPNASQPLIFVQHEIGSVLGARSFVYGVVNREVGALALRGRDGPSESLPIAPDGTFLVVRKGIGRLHGYRLTARVDGRLRSYLLG